MEGDLIIKLCACLWTIGLSLFSAFFLAKFKLFSYSYMFIYHVFHMFLSIMEENLTLFASP